MMKLIFATNNQHKVDEIRHVIGDKFELLTLKESGVNIDIPEPYKTLQENATTKSQTIYELKNISCFSEDSGLEVDALNGEPGVKSARYGGDERAPEKNIDKLLENLEGKTDTNARFRTVISLIIDGSETLFEGVCEGRIIRERKGNKGFGYDPIFVPDGSDKTFAEMELPEKQQFSHRAKATQKLVTFLSQWTPMKNIPDQKSQS